MVQECASLSTKSVIHQLHSKNSLRKGLNASWTKLETSWCEANHNDTTYNIFMLFHPRVDGLEFTYSTNEGEKNENVRRTPHEIFVVSSKVEVDGCLCD